MLVLLPPILFSAASLNPPRPIDTSDAAQQELSSRLVVAIASAVHSGGAHVSAADVDQLHIIATMLNSFLPTMSSGYVYRWGRCPWCLGQLQAATVTKRTCCWGRQAVRTYTSVWTHGSGLGLLVWLGLHASPVPLC